MIPCLILFSCHYTQCEYIKSLFLLQILEKKMHPQTSKFCYAYNANIVLQFFLDRLGNVCTTFLLFFL